MGWSGGIAEWVDGDTAHISIVFSWMLPKAYQRAAWYVAQGYKVRAGGPAVWVRPKYLENVAEVGGNILDAVAHHNPDATFASRGCPVGCYFCIVPRMEGINFTLLPEFIPRPILCDNNLSGLPVDYQEFVIKKYQDWNVPLEDANSGFEPRSFGVDTYYRWKAINRGPWRFALDEMKELGDVRRMMEILKNEPPYKKRVYVLIGNEPIDQCYERVMKVIEWGGEPHCQPIMALNTLRRKPQVRHDWTERLLYDFARWANRWIWRTVPLAEYRPRKHEPPPFASPQMRMPL